MSPSDHDLLRRYAEENSETAFAALVERHLNLAYSVARRVTGSAQLAEDVAQAVFIDLARDARALKPGTPLVAWLHVVSRRTAIDTVRRESRRHAREAAADIRVALAKLRSVARKKFATSLQAALRRYLAGSPDLGVALKAMKLQWDGDSLNFSYNFEWGGKRTEPRPATKATFSPRPPFPPPPAPSASSPWARSRRRSSRRLTGTTRKITVRLCPRSR